MVSESVEELEQRIINYAKKYYDGEPEISNEYFDSLVEQLKLAHPESYVLKTTGWGGVTNREEYVDHLFDLREDLKRERVDPSNPEIFIDNMSLVTPKFDGANVTLYFISGILVQALTRGDGTKGKQVTRHMKKILSPSVLSSMYQEKRTISLTGEVIVPLKYEKELKDRGVADVRNFASGFLNRDSVQKDSEYQFLQFIPFRINREEGDSFLSDFDYINKKLHFIETLPYEEQKVDLNEIHQGWESKYPIDGLVVYTYSEKTVENERKLTNKIAYKFPSETARVICKDVEMTLSPKGKIVPVATFDPVNLTGANIERASAHNMKYVMDKGMGTGSVLKIMRSGKIIPYILEVENSGNIAIPNVCPSCGSKLKNEVESGDGVNLRCENILCSCRRMDQINKIIEICGRPRGLGDSSIEKVVESLGFDINSLITFSLKPKDKRDKLIDKVKEDILKDHYGELFRKLIDNINRKLSAGISYVEFWYIIGLEGVGEKESNKLNFLCSEVSLEENFEENSVPMNVKSEIKKNIKNITKFYRFIMEQGVALYPVANCSNEEYKPIPVCITGKLEFGSRRSFIDYYGLEEASVSKSSCVISNSSDRSNKIKEAEDKGIPVLSEEEFLNQYIRKAV